MYLNLKSNSKLFIFASMGKKVILVILDGWGKGRLDDSNAIYKADTPFVDKLYATQPNSELITFGEQVGLPAGQMGNSEVGHMNIGAGRIVYQELLRINNAIKNKTLNTNPVLLKAIQYAKENNKPVHFMGLLSDGGVHSHIEHLKALTSIAHENGVKEQYVHAFMDGRDTDPKSGKSYLLDIEQHLEKISGKIASVIGRYYAMDRDNRWERIKLAYDLLIHGKGVKSNNIQAAIQHSYDEGITDEFVKPIIAVDENDTSIATIKEGDVVICFNYRTDRCREITQVLTQNDRLEDGMQTIDLQYFTMTEYDKKFKGINILFKNEDIKMTLGEVLEKNNKSQLRIAETEKYAHVTFFFSGGKEAAFGHEDRILIQSPKVATYDMQPEMSAIEVKDKVVAVLKKANTDYICLNFANTDMVGHTGIFKAAMKAASTVDACLKEVVETAVANDYAVLVTADHGNSDYLVNEDGSPNTAHSMNPVPLFVINTSATSVKNGKLADLAPTILSIMGIDIPKEMTGEILI